MIPLAVAALVITDASFAGFRAAAGREGRIRKRGYYARAMLRAAVAGVGLVAIMAGLTAAVVRSAATPGATWAELLAMGARLVMVFGAYAVLVAAALLVYLSTRDEVRTLASVILLGPMTLVRPWVVVAGTAWAVALASSVATYTLAWVASAATLGLGALLDRMHRHRVVVPGTPAGGGLIPCAAQRGGSDHE